MGFAQARQAALQEQVTWAAFPDQVRVAEIIGQLDTQTHARKGIVRRCCLSAHAYWCLTFMVSQKSSKTREGLLDVPRLHSHQHPHPSTLCLNMTSTANEGVIAVYTRRRIPTHHGMRRHDEIAREVLDASKLAADDPAKQFAISFFDNKATSLLPLMTDYFAQ